MFGLDQATFPSVSAYGTATAPAAGGAIVTLAAGSLPAGVYDVNVTARYDGTPGTGERDNMELRAGATVKRRILINDVADNYGDRAADMRVYLDGATALSVNATAIGTAGAIYTALLIARRVA